jgi:glycosyltransferase involved in cell wall biosynthesis
MPTLENQDKKPKAVIHAYILCWNEEEILPYTLNHYGKFCDRIFLLDNMSDDGSLTIAKGFANVTVMQWDSGGQIRDDLYIQLKSNVYKRSRGVADWVIVCDADEFLVGYEELAELKSKNCSAPKIEGYQMTSRFFPRYRADMPQITAILKCGFRDNIFDKQIVFNPELELTFGIGAHSFKVVGKQPIVSTSGLKLLHYKYLGADYLHAKNVRSEKRLSSFNKNSGAGKHYYTDLERAKQNIRECLDRSARIIN